MKEGLVNSYHEMRSSKRVRRITVAILLLMIAAMVACLISLMQSHQESSPQTWNSIRSLSLLDNGVEKVHANDGKVYIVPERTAIQIENYRQGKGLLLNLHITHHGGTTVCAQLGRSPDAIGRAPKSACNQELGMKENTGYSFNEHPWSGEEETARMIPMVRHHFHMIGWEFGYMHHLPHPALNETDWENPNLLSLLVVRDPISRLLAGSGWVNQNIPNIAHGNATKEDWWAYANNTWFTNNYALRVLAGDGCCDGASTDRKHLENAKALVDRMSIVLDIECLSEGIEAVANLLDISVANKDALSSARHHAPSRQRIGHDDVYDYLVEKNKLDIELYQYSKQRALINCSAL